MVLYFYTISRKYSSYQQIQQYWKDDDRSTDDVDDKDLKDDIATKMQALLKESLNNYIAIYSANWYLNI